MTAKQELDKPAEAEKPVGHDNFNALVGAQVIQALGKPPDFQRVQVRCLWDSCYRVNVYVGETTAFARIVNSYFVHANTEGRVLTSNPIITKQYGA